MNTSFDGETKCIVDSKFGSVLVIYTGGTIGMKINRDGGETMKTHSISQSLS